MADTSAGDATTPPADTDTNADTSEVDTARGASADSHGNRAADVADTSPGSPTCVGAGGVPHLGTLDLLSHPSVESLKPQHKNVLSQLRSLPLDASRFLVFASWTVSKHAILIRYQSLSDPKPIALTATGPEPDLSSCIWKAIPTCAPPAIEVYNSLRRPMFRSGGFAVLQQRQQHAHDAIVPVDMPDGWTMNETKFTQQLISFRGYRPLSGDLFLEFGNSGWLQVWSASKHQVLETHKPCAETPRTFWAEDAAYNAMTDEFLVLGYGEATGTVGTNPKQYPFGYGVWGSADPIPWLVAVHRKDPTQLAWKTALPASLGALAHTGWGSLMVGAKGRAHALLGEAEPSVSASLPTPYAKSAVVTVTAQGKTLWLRRPFEQLGLSAVRMVTDHNGDVILVGEAIDPSSSTPWLANGPTRMVRLSGADGRLLRSRDIVPEAGTAPQAKSNMFDLQVHPNNGFMFSGAHRVIRMDAWFRSSCEASGGCFNLPYNSCTDGDPCTEDLCMPGNQCAYVPLPDGATCARDFDSATGWCKQGSCTP